MDISLTKVEKVLVNLHQDFIENARETLDRIEELSFLRGPQSGDAIAEIYRDVHNIKGSAATFGLAAVSILAHRFEDFLNSLKSIDAPAGDAILAYVDALRGLVNREDDIAPDDLAALIKKLPHIYNQDFDIEAALDVEIVLVTPSGAVGKLLARDLRACGYRVITLNSAWQALQLAVCAPPDLIITAVVMDQLSGIDLARAIKAMQCTAKQRLAILTSFDDKHQALAGIPDGVPIIHNGKSFMDDLAQALSDVGIV